METNSFGIDRIPGLSGRDLVFYDGRCALCHSTVRFFLRRDREGLLFVFAPIGGKTVRGAIPPTAEQSLPDSVAVRTLDGRLLLRSAAVSYLLSRLGRPWNVPARALSLVPTRVADAAYSAVARARRALFGTTDDWCPVSAQELRTRFLE
jgi:predicted DCC family thiol-disulfide oxidoreductase YuxK